MSRKYLILSALTLLALVRIASACSCALPMTVLDEFETSDEVVILRVVSVEKVDDGNKQKYVDGVRSTNMIVEKTFKGRLRVGDEIVFGQGGGADCVWTFHEQLVGQQFLFYLTRPEKLGDWGPREPGLWLGEQCGRSAGLKYVADDLLYLETLTKCMAKPACRERSVIGPTRTWTLLERKSGSSVKNKLTYRTGNPARVEDRSFPAPALTKPGERGPRRQRRTRSDEASSRTT